MIAKENRNTRERIMKSMYRLVAIHGYEKTALSMICSELDIKKPSLYYYFKSKEIMFISVFEELVFENDKTEFNFDVTKESYKNELLRTGFATIDIYKEDPLLASVMMEFYIQSKRIESVGIKIKEYDRKYKEYVRDILKLGVRLGVFSKTFNVNENTDLLLNTLQGTEFSIVFDFELDNKRVIEKVVNSMFVEELNV